MKRLWMRLFLLLFLCITGLVVCRADELATVTGLVTDPNGRSVPGVVILITNLSTNVASRAVTNDQGIYRIPSLQPGIYRITLAKDGFKSIVKSGIELHVQDVASINFELQLGSVNETVTVEAGAPLINTESAAVSTVVDRQFAENLPLNGRSFQTLIQLTPGVVLTANNGVDTGQFSVNGQRASSNYWMVDGVSANIGISAFATSGNGLGGTVGSFSVLGGTNSLVSVDALQEFRIETSTFAPEFGRTPGAQIAIATRSGANQFHGTLFDYLRNDVLDANDWFADSKGLPKAKERQNDFGGTFSGPVLRDRTFFFFSYEGLRLRLPTTRLTNVPCDSTCAVFGNARTMAASTMQPFLNAYPLPNGPEVFTPCMPNVGGCPSSGQRPTGGAQFNKSYSNPGTLDAYSLRLDHKLGTNFSLFGRYNYSPSELSQRGFAGNALSVVEPARIKTQTGTAGLTWIISPGTVNDARFNYSSTSSSSRTFSDGFGGAVPVPSFPFPSGFSATNAAFNVLIRSLGSTATTGQTLRVGTNAHNSQRQINIVDSISAQLGGHALKFGIDFRRLSPDFDLANYAQTGTFLNVSRAETGNTQSVQLFSRLPGTLLFRNLGLFAQDTWRVSPRITLTYGLRWDIDVAPSALNGPNFSAVTGFDLKNLSSLALAPAGTAPYQTTYGNIAPRVGLAYQLSRSQGWQTVFRGGFGLFYDLATSEAGNALPLNFYPFGTQVRKPGAIFPVIGPPPAITPPSAGSGVLSAFDPNLELPYTMEWNVALEQGLGRQQTVSGSYIGAVGRRLLQTADILAPNSNFALAQLVTNAATSDYHALQLQYQRRLSHGLQALASYAWSHSIDTASAGSIASGSNSLTAINPSVNRGSSDFDVRSAFSTGLTYDLPGPKRKGFADAILTGWSMENVFQARTAPPVNVFYSGFFEISGGFLTSVRPNIVGGQPLYLYGPNFPGGRAFNATAFSTPPTDPITGIPTGQGNFPRNGLRGFGYAQWDFAVHRVFPIRESLKLEFRAEMFNILNHPNFGQPIGDLLLPSAVNPQFGQSIEMLGQSLSGQSVGGGVGTGGFDPLYQIGGPRSIQFGLKLEF